MFEIPPPIVTFIVGILASELMQMGFWIRKNPKSPKLGYFTEQSGVLIANMGVNAAVCVLWSFQGLDAVLGWLSQWVPGTAAWATSGVPYTPQMGLMLGCLSDFFGDDVAYNLVSAGKSWLGKRTPPVSEEGTTTP